MTLVDTSVWVGHLRGEARSEGLADLLEANEAMLHPWVLGELVLGNLGEQRDSIVADLTRLPSATLVRDEEVLELIRVRSLAGSGIGWVDAQLLASALVESVAVWTLDGALTRAVERVGLAY